jgi:hypothetical protein
MIVALFCWSFGGLARRLYVHLSYIKIYYDKLCPAPVLEGKVGARLGLDLVFVVVASKFKDLFII